jgi:hypothetical protein
MTQDLHTTLALLRPSNGQSEPYTPFAGPHHPEGPKSDRSY